MHAIMMDFGIWGRLTRPRGPFRAQGSALTRNVARSHGSKNLLQRTILYRHKRVYRHKRNYHGREDCRPRPGETICRIWSVFHSYLWIFVFVWARVLCGTRTHQSASVDCSGVIQKIHMRKIRLDQGLVHDEDFLIFHGLGTSDEAKWTLQGPGVRADAALRVSFTRR